MRPPIRVLLADDSETARSALSAALAPHADLQVVAQARDGLEALELAKSVRPDVITMDVQMPRLNGLEATAAIMAEAPSRILVVASVMEGAQVELSFRAIRAGALEVLAKPHGGGAAALSDFGRRVASAIRLMAEIPVVRRWRAPAPVPIPRLRAAGSCDIIGLVASTGGPPALSRLLSALPANLPCPILIAQHIAPGFAAGLRRWFADSTSLSVEIGRDGQACLPGHVILAPDGMDLTVDEQRLVRVQRSPGGHCPSGDRLLGSLARAYGAGALGVVMTGMGEDGAAGLLDIRRAGGVTIAQDEASSVVYGMPQAAFKNGAAALVVPLDGLGGAIVDSVRPRSSLVG